MKKTEIFTLAMFAIIVAILIIRHQKRKNTPPKLELLEVDKIRKTVKFVFADNDPFAFKRFGIYDSKIGKTEKYEFKGFTLVVQDVYLDSVFQRISFEIYKENKLVKVLEPEIDYYLW